MGSEGDGPGRLRAVPGLEDLENRACTDVSPHVHPELTHLSRVMEPAIEQVSERVFSAVGFDSANSTFVVGDDGIVVIDAMTSTENMGRGAAGLPRDLRAARSRAWSTPTATATTGPARRP